VRYQYRLLGLDTEWTTVDATARSPSFGPLQPGRYTLEVVRPAKSISTQLADGTASNSWS
jgi:hypothetical protein